MNEYFTRFGAADYNIFHNGNTSYVMLRVADENMTYFALFEHTEGHDGVGCRMFDSPTEWFWTTPLTRRAPTSSLPTSLDSLTPLSSTTLISAGFCIAPDF